jgi:uncharacterized protein (DUF2235 family)
MKRIVICCDGTGNEYSENNTNVVLLYDVVVKDANQVAFYDPGVGTGGWVYNEESGKFNAKSDQATGGGLQKNVEDAYRFLMDTWEPGDKVYIFGFSRGGWSMQPISTTIRRDTFTPRGSREHSQGLARSTSSACGIPSSLSS